MRCTQAWTSGRAPRFPSGTTTSGASIVPGVATQVPPRSTGAKSPGGDSKAPRRQGKQANFRARKRRQQRNLAVAAVVVVVAVIAILIGVKAGGGNKAGIDGRSAISSTALHEVLGVTPVQMKAAADNRTLSSYPIPVSSAPLTSAGKPELLYIGAEYCPYCAGERWAMVMALSQFGTFHGLRSIISSPTDTVASIPTFTFYQSTYSSPYLAFTPVEQQTVSGKPLEKTTTAEEATLTKFDGPPYVRSGGIPFLDLGNKWVQDGINFNNASMSGQSFDSIAGQLGSGGNGPSTPVSGSIAATAGVLVSHLCALTGGASLNNGAACRAFPSVISKAPTA